VGTFEGLSAASSLAAAHAHALQGGVGPAAVRGGTVGGEGVGLVGHGSGTALHVDGGSSTSSGVHSSPGRGTRGGWPSKGALEGEEDDGGWEEVRPILPPPPSADDDVQQYMRALYSDGNASERWVQMGR
jgi:hypothetical protein